MTDRDLDEVRTDLDRVRALRSQPVTPPEADLGSALDTLAQHITYEHKCGSQVKAQQLAVVRDQLSALRARWGCR